MSGPSPRDDDHDDDFDAGPAFTHGPGMMGPPMQPGEFDTEMARDMTPRRAATKSHQYHPDDDLYDEMTWERASPPSPMSPHGGGQEFAAELGPPGPMLGQHPEGSEYHGTYTGDFQERPSLLTEGFADGQTLRGMEGMPAPGYGQEQAPANAPPDYGQGQAPADAPPGNVPQDADEEMEEDLYGMSGSPSSGSSGYSSGWSVE
ncbi:hypothetical protein B0A55_05441 [Friedmanniomyces simplex]|uniref:Uncharacterized protein n=1 Tax=Friedmanniomyces simplex TaxID=329884 RepID=A0A4U0XCX7_9PEZI|nr:hypothetical protein B0A55_05441 [Friedmanniomyces simplex]